MKAPKLPSSMVMNICFEATHEDSNPPHLHPTVGAMNVSNPPCSNPFWYACHAAGPLRQLGLCDDGAPNPLDAIGKYLFRVLSEMGIWRAYKSLGYVLQ